MAIKKKPLFNFSIRITTTFGSELVYIENTDHGTAMIEALKIVKRKIKDKTYWSKVTGSTKILITGAYIIEYLPSSHLEKTLPSGKKMNEPEFKRYLKSAGDVVPLGGGERGEKAYVLINSLDGNGRRMLLPKEEGEE